MSQIFTACRENGRRRPRGYAAWRPQAATRALLADVQAVVERYDEHLPLTIRQVFYNLVAHGRLDKTELAYARLCEHLNRARRARLIPFEVIRDDGVVTMRSQSYDSVEDSYDETGRRARDYRRDRQAGQPTYLEVWCEAAGMLHQLDAIADGYTIPVYSAGGFASLSATRAIANRALSRSVPTVILHVGDFDPSGESIFASMIEDATAFVSEDRVLGPTYTDLRGVRVALTERQVAEYDLPTAPTKASDSRAWNWDGGTCQLEALPPDTLAEVIRDAINSHIDNQALAPVLEAECVERAALLGLPS
jgi:hypothetical protein